MPYKDKQKQKEAVRLATQRYRARLRAAAQGITDGITPDGGITLDVTPDVTFTEEELSIKYWTRPFTGPLTKEKQVKGFHRQ